MKTICIYHSRDLDGWMSAAIVKRWHESINDYPDDIGKGTLDFLGYDYGNEIPNLQDYDKVIMCDISFPDDVMLNIYELFGKDNFTWIDHHISAMKAVEKRFSNHGTIKGLRNTEFAACELVWQYFFPDVEMPEIVRLLGRYDCFGHKGTDEEQKVLEFQYGARATLTNYEECYTELVCSFNSITFEPTNPEYTQAIQDLGKGIYKYLCTEAKQTYAKAFPIKLDEPIFGDNKSGGGYTRNFLCVNQDRFNPINFGIDYHNATISPDGKAYDGFACFWYKDGKWNFSLYNDNGEVDCSVIAKQFGGGGHKGAAGFVIDDLNKIF